jgi:hypothetical protein
VMMNNRWVILLAMVALVAMVGCTSSDVKRTGDNYPPRPDDWPIGVYMSASAPVELVKAFPHAKRSPPPYEEIGFGKSDSTIFVAWRRLEAQAKAKARAMGGDAILVLDFVRDYPGDIPNFQYRILRWKE